MADAINRSVEAAALETAPPEAASRPSHKQSMAKKPEWAPRFWQGCNVYAWMRLLIKNRFAVHPSLWYIAIIVTVVSVFHSMLGWLQAILYGRALARTKLTAPPIFILGHWRTGTTLLHELMIQDPRFGYPTTYECLEPNHFLITEKFFSRWMTFLLPKERPMDKMKAGWGRPQEDEFALCMMGVPSPYLTIAFPNHPPQDSEYLDLEGVPPRALARWKNALMSLLVRITYKTNKRLVLKSPPHTARVKVLREMFPGALFIHLVRDPYVVFPSTVNLWRTLYATQGMQKPTNEGIEEFVLSTYERMDAKMQEAKRLLPAEQLFELRYEDLVQDPTAAMRCIYDHFHLDGWPEMQIRLDKYLATLKGYETNKYQLTPDQRRKIDARWGAIIRREGYEKPDDFFAADETEAAVAAK